MKKVPLNEQSIKQLDERVAKNYYFRINEEGLLTLELVDDKDMQECVALTVHCINEMKKEYDTGFIENIIERLPEYDAKSARQYLSVTTLGKKAHKNGYRLATREVKKLLKSLPITPKPTGFRRLSNRRGNR